MMSDTRRRKPKPILLPTEGIFNLSHHIVMAWEELAFDDGWHCRLYAAGKWSAAQLNVMVVMGFVPLSPGAPTQWLNQLSYLLTHPRCSEIKGLLNSKYFGSDALIANMTNGLDIYSVTRYKAILGIHKMSSPGKGGGDNWGLFYWITFELQLYDPMISRYLKTKAVTT